MNVLIYFFSNLLFLLFILHADEFDINRVPHEKNNNKITKGGLNSLKGDQIITQMPINRIPMIGLQLFVSIFFFFWIFQLFSEKLIKDI